LARQDPRAIAHDSCLRSSLKLPHHEPLQAGAAAGPCASGIKEANGERLEFLALLFS